MAPEEKTEAGSQDNRTYVAVAENGKVVGCLGEVVEEQILFVLITKTADNRILKVAIPISKAFVAFVHGGKLFITVRENLSVTFQTLSERHMTSNELMSDEKNDEPKGN